MVSASERAVTGERGYMRGDSRKIHPVCVCARATAGSTCHCPMQLALSPLSQSCSLATCKHDLIKRVPFVAGEMFPLVNRDKPNPLKLFQIWLNLPAKNKMVTPAFVMHWAERIPRVTNQGYTVTVFAGEFQGAKGLPPPPHSWAADPANDVCVWHMRLDKGASLTVPAAHSGGKANRCLYLTAGDSVNIGGRKVDKGHFAKLDASLPVEVRAESASGVELLLLQGCPIGEPVAQHGPFVMNTRLMLGFFLSWAYFAPLVCF